MRLQAMRRVLSFMALAVACVAAQGVQAHHSAASFDTAHPVVATGTVKEFRWENPHAWLYLMVPNAQGSADEWEIEGPSVVMLARNGWNPATLTPGEKVHVLMARRKDGTFGGSFMQVTKDNGDVLSTGRL
jgi:Family of unknown function (DUF6152)